MAAQMSDSYSQRTFNQSDLTAAGANHKSHRGRGSEALNHVRIVRHWACDDNSNDCIAAVL